MNTLNILEVFVAVLMNIAATCSAAEGTWTRKADMPTARLGLTTSTVNGKIYAIGGGNSIDGTAFRTVAEYDPATDTWTRKTDMPTRRYFHSASVVNGKVYIIGGAVAEKVTTPTVEEYDPATDTWTMKADMPTARCFFSASVVNDKIYTIGGQIFPANSSVSTVEEYDPATDTWTTKADMPTVRSMLCASAVDGRVYAMGGVQGWIGGPGLSTVEAYDPVTDTWTRRADMPTPRKGLSTLVMAEKIVAIGGGTDAYGPVYSVVEEYDPKANTWAKKPNMPTARWFFSASSVNGKVYAIGGSVQYTHDATSTVKIVEEYDLTPPPPDFNGDGKVDGRDVMILAESWGQGNPLCDIAPGPFGDGLVNVEDLIVLADYIGADIEDRTLIAHWALDEADGVTAHDSAGNCDATACGQPLWQPDGGAVDGALALDGADDFLATDFVLEPSEGPFSVLAWVKGGAPGQAVLSQIDGENWLGADPTSGFLMTELKGTGRGSCALHSETAISADGDWHRIGLTWDGTNRCLHVDDSVVAEDTQAGGLGSCSGAMNIGCDKAMTPGTFFSGLIDDVRIYNRAVQP